MNTPEQDEIRLLQWVNVLLSHRLLIVLLMLVGAGAAFALCRTAEPLFTAEAKLRPNPEAAALSLKSLFLTNMPRSPLEAADRLSMSQLANYYSELLQSDALLGPIARRTWAGGRTLEAFYPGGKGDATRRQRRLVSLLRRRVIEIVQDRLSGMITIQCTTRDPYLSADITAAMLEHLEAHLREDTTSATAALIRMAEERTSQAQAAVTLADEELINFKNSDISVTAVSPPPEVAARLSKLERRVKLQEEMYIRMKTQVEMLRLSEQQEMNLIEVIHPPKIPVSASWPPTVSAVAGAALFGLLLGVTISFVRHGIAVLAARGLPEYAEFEAHVRSLNWILPGIVLLLPAGRRRRRPVASRTGGVDSPPLAGKVERP